MKFIRPFVATLNAFMVGIKSNTELQIFRKHGQQSLETPKKTDHLMKKERFFLDKFKFLVNLVGFFILK